MARYVKRADEGYLCAVCLEHYTGPWAYQDARWCCAIAKGISYLPQIEEIAAAERDRLYYEGMRQQEEERRANSKRKSERPIPTRYRVSKSYLGAIARAVEMTAAPPPHQPTPRIDKPPGDGTRRPDKWGHWYRGTRRLTPAYMAAQYHKARARLQRERYLQQSAALNQTYGPALDHALGVGERVPVSERARITGRAVMQGTSPGMALMRAAKQRQQQGRGSNRKPGPPPGQK